MTMINKKTRQKVVASIGKIGIEFHLPHSYDIDARIKFIYIDSSHIKLLRCFLNIDSSHIYKNNLESILDVNNN